jgi:RimJ/RimL family protein N-acetyltransferase
MKADLSTLQLETARLILRPPRLDDFEAWAAFHSDEVATRFVGGPQARGLAWRTFMCMCGAWHMTGVAMFSVIEKASGRWVGRLGPWRPDGWPDAEVGWSIAREHWGKGYASEGAAAAMDYAFNLPSIGVARKLGSTLQGRVRLPAPFEASICDAWGQSREEWSVKREGR